MEGTLFFLEQSQIVREAFKANSRASFIVGSLVHGNAVLVMRGRKGSFLYNLFRYEALNAYNAETGKKLSSDAFTQYTHPLFFSALGLRDLSPHLPSLSLSSFSPFPFNYLSISFLDSLHCRSFGRHNSSIHNQEVFDAFYWLIGKRMSEFIDEEVGHSERCLLPSELVHTFQKWGFNLRLLGFFRSLLKIGTRSFPVLLA